MTRADRIRNLLVQLDPIQISITNDSSRHMGHSGDDGSGETHFIVRLVSERFSSMTKVDRQRLVMSLLRPEFDSGLHALTLELKSLQEI